MGMEYSVFRKQNSVFSGLFADGNIFFVAFFTSVLKHPLFEGFERLVMMGGKFSR